MNKQPRYLVYAYLLHKGKYPFDESLMWAFSKEEAQKLREEWLSSQEEEEKEYIIREAEILMPHPEKPGLLVNHLWRPPYREDYFFE